MRRALAAVSGTDPVTGAPYAAGYAGLPAELEALQARLLEDAEEVERTSPTASTRPSINLKKLANGAEETSPKACTGSQAAATSSPTAPNGSPTPPQQLGDGLARLSGGAAALVGGIDRLSGGAEALEAGLAEGLRAHRRRCRAGCERGQRPGARRQGADQPPGAPGRAKPRPASSTRATSCSRRSTARRRGPREAAGEGDRPRTRRPGGVDAGRSPNYSLQHARLDRAQQAARRGRRGARPRKPASTTGVAGGAAQLNDYSQRHPGADPARSIAAITLATFLVLSSSCGRSRWRRSRSASTCSRSASPSASSPCSSTCPTTGRWAATTTSTRSARR